MNAQGALLVRPVAVASADAERDVFTAKLNTEFTRFVLVGGSTDSMVEIRHIPRGGSTGVQHRIYRESVTMNTVKHVLEALAEGQGVTLEAGDRISIICNKTDTYVKAYGVTQSTKQVYLGS